MRRPLLIAALAGTLLATPALADVTVRYRAVLPEGAPANVRENPPTMTVSADGAGQARMEMSAPGGPAGGAGQPGFALISREGVTYLSANGPQPGMQIITRMDDAMAVISQVARPLLQGSARDGLRQVMQQRVEITPVGPEIVSGVRGNLYRVAVVMGETRTPPVEIVVATDPRLAPVGQAFSGLFESMRPMVTSLLGGEPQAYMAMRGLAGLGAPLRIGNHVRLESVSTEDVPDNRFAVPGPVLTRDQLQQIVGMMMGMMRSGQGMHSPAAPAAPPATPPGNAATPH